MGDVVLYPLLKKTDFKVEDVENITEDQIDSVSEHFTKQLVHHFHNLGLPESQTYYNDVNFMSEVIRAIMYRTFSKYHFFQDIIDEVNDKIYSTLEDEIEEN